MVQNALQRMVDALAERLGRSVAIDDPAVRLVCVSRHFGDEDAVRVQAVLQRSPSSAAIGHILSQGVTKWKAPGVIPARADIGMGERLCMPLRWRGTLLGLLMVIEPEDSLDDAQLATIATVSHDIAALMYRDFLSEDAQRVAREHALQDLLSSQPSRRETGENFLDDTRQPRGAAVATVSVADVLDTDPGAETAEIEVALRSAMERVSRGRERRDVSAAMDRQGVLLQLWSTPPTATRLREAAALIIQHVEDFLGTSSRCVIGIGGTSSGSQHAWVSREQAGIAARAAALLPQLGGIAAWSDLGAYGLLLRIPQEHLTRSALPEPLRTLAAHDPHGRLRETITAYLDHAGSSPATATALHIHRTSLYYRLHQIEDITGLDLNNGDHRLQLHLGLRLATLVEAGDRAM
ncbi:MAG: PucR family transcriptional regulator [Sciscionella sp.]